MQFFRKSSESTTDERNFFHIGNHRVRRRPHSKHTIRYQNDVYGVEILGEGGFSKVVPAVNEETGQRVAIKVCDKKKCDKYLDTEISIMNRLHHENIVELLSVDQDSDNVFITLEFVGGGTMHKHINSYRVSGTYLERHELKRYFRQLIAGIEHCHQNNIAHRDLKLANILLDDEKETLKLCDFGLSSVDQDTVKGMRGTRHFMAPEVFESKQNGTRYSPYSCDIWGAGVILFLMAARDYPFHPTIVESPHWGPISNNNGVELPTQLTDMYGMELTDMLNGLWMPDPQDRFTLDDIKNHPFLSQDEDAEVEYDSDGVIMGSSNNQGGYVSDNTVKTHPSTSMGSIDLDQQESQADNNDGMETESAHNEGDMRVQQYSVSEVSVDGDYNVPYVEVNPGGPGDQERKDQMSTVESFDDDDEVRFRSVTGAGEEELACLMSFHGKLDKGDNECTTRFISQLDPMDMYEKVLAVLSYDPTQLVIEENEKALEIYCKTTDAKACNIDSKIAMGNKDGDDDEGIMEHLNEPDDNGDVIMDEKITFTVSFYSINNNKETVVDFQRHSGCLFGYYDMYAGYMKELSQYEKLDMDLLTESL